MIDMLMFGGGGDDTERKVLGHFSESCSNGGKEDHSGEGGRSSSYPQGQYPIFFFGCFDSS